MSLGTLFGISVGPGDPELITLKGLRLLQQSPVVAFPAGVRGQPGIAQQIVADWLNPTHIQLALQFPYVQEWDVLYQAWQVAADRVWQYLYQGQDVAFVCEGDVSFYSTFTYLAQTLQHAHPDVKVQAIPGVCSPLAATAALGLPLTIRQQRLVVLPALYHVANQANADESEADHPLTELENALKSADVVVLMKVSSVYSQVWRLLQRYQLLEHSYVVERATLPQQVIYRDLHNRPNLELPYFSLLIIFVNGNPEMQPSSMQQQPDDRQ